MPPGRSANQRLPRPEGWSLASPPAFSRLDPVVRSAVVGQALDRLDGVGMAWDDATLTTVSAGGERMPSAVLALCSPEAPPELTFASADSATRSGGSLGSRGDGPFILITRRPWAMRSHPGELSFPGGSREPGESFADTALRETNEEVGIRRDAPRLAGVLPILRTFSSDRAVVPFLGHWSGIQPTTNNPDEVEEVIFVPLRHLIADGVCWRERWGFDVGAVPSAGARRRKLAAGERLHIDVTFFDLGEDVIWGATAAILADFLERLMAPELRAIGVHESDIGRRTE